MRKSSNSKDQVARTVITGAGSGIGRAFAIEAAARGVQTGREILQRKPPR